MEPCMCGQKGESKTTHTRLIFRVQIRVGYEIRTRGVETSPDTLLYKLYIDAFDQALPIPHFLISSNSAWLLQALFLVTIHALSLSVNTNSNNYKYRGNAEYLHC